MRVDTELAHEVYQKDDSPQPDWTVQSNPTFLSRVETGDFKASLEGALLDNDQLTLKGTVVTGRNEEPDDYNASAYRVVFFTGPAVSTEKIRLGPLDSGDRSLH
jgi:hypothetical protein